MRLLIDPDRLGRMDLIITLCGDARDRCPVTPPNVRRLHWPLPDPAAVEGPEEHVSAAFREARNEIRRRVRQLLDEQGADLA